MTETNKYITLTDKNFQKEVLESKEPVLVDFCISWRGSTHIMAPTINELATDFKGRINVGRLDVDKYPDMKEKYGICVIPTFLIFKNGLVVDQILGIARKIDFADKLYSVLLK